VFSGRRFRTEIYPRVREFMRAFQSEASRTAKRAKLKVVSE
jgi:poly-beta-hydroxyalkanoate depolymerase